MVRPSFMTLLFLLPMCVTSLPRHRVIQPKTLPHAYVSNYVLGDCSVKLGKDKMIRIDECTDLDGHVGSLEVVKVGWGVYKGRLDRQLFPLRECGVILFPETKCRGRGYGIGDFNSTAQSVQLGKYKSKVEEKTCVRKPDELATAQSAQVLCYTNKFGVGFRPETSNGFFDQVVNPGSLWVNRNKPGPEIRKPCSGDCGLAD